MEDRGYRKLNVYKKADELAILVYKGRDDGLSTQLIKLYDEGRYKK